MDEVKRKRVSELLESYGSDPARWPVADREMLGEASVVDAGPHADAMSIDGVLSQIAQVDVPGNFDHRLMRRVSLESKRPAIAEQKAPRWNPSRWFVALPLAASLMLGFYLGAEGMLDRILPTSVTGTVAAGDDDLGGFDSVTDYSEDQLS